MKTGILLVVAIAGAVACSSESPDSLRRHGDDDGTTDGKNDPKTSVIAPSGGSVRAPYQVKTTTEIASAIDSCFGKGVTTISPTMIQTADNPAGFLAARQFAAGADVVVGEAPIIDGDPSVGRTGVRNSTLSLPILASLQDIGNVVGENCALQPDNASCNCKTQETAHAMLARCLPSVAPSRYQALEASFADTCSKDPATAIASLLASTAFGVQ